MNEPGLMIVNVSEERMRAAHRELGRPADLAEALVETGITAFFWLLAHGDVEIDGRVLRLVEVDRNMT